MVDLGTRVKGIRTNTGSGSWFRLSLGLRLDLVEELGPNQRVDVHIYFPSMECDFLRFVVHVQDL